MTAIDPNIFLNSSQHPCCFLVVCGIPGSGKSTLSHWLRDKFEDTHISCHVMSFDDYEFPSTMWDSESFVKSRALSLTAIEKRAKQHQDRVLIVDDIMFYSSMRREIYKLSRSCGAGYAVIHLDVCESVAQRRNAMRSEETRVKDEVQLHT